MRPVKNKSKGRKIRMYLDDERFVDCWLCGEPQPKDDGTSYMHPICWEKASAAQRSQAERDCAYGYSHELEYICQGCGGPECVR